MPFVALWVTTGMTERYALATDEGKRRAVEPVQSAVSSIRLKAIATVLPRPKKGSRS